MQDRVKINDDVTVGGQPTEGQLAGLARAGFRAVVNLRTAGEQDQPLSPEAEGKEVRALGMAYLHLPVSTKDLKAEQVDEFRRELADLPKPAFVHCYVGIRAGALMMMSLAVDQGRLLYSSVAHSRRKRPSARSSSPRTSASAAGSPGSASR
jgi:uncharacterized protein (TIGR01244 family)